MKHAFAALAAVMLSVLPASADGVVDKLMTPADKQRLASYDKVRAEALAEARKAGAAADVKTLDAVVGRTPQSFDGFDMTGNWKCRTIKVGGMAELIVYGWFKCKVTDDGSGWLLEKTSGSQRTTGRFYTESDTRQIYLGSFFVAGEKPKPYGSGADSDQVGYAFRTGKAEWRIELPSPRYESKLDVMEFKR